MRASFRPPTTESSLVAHAPVLTLRQIFGRFRGDLRAVRGWIALSLVFVVLTPAVEAAEIWLFKLVVDQVLVPKDLSALPALALAYIGINLVQGALGFVDDVVAAATSTRFVHRLRTRTFDHLLRLGPEYLERHRLGDLVTRISGDVSAIETLLLDGLTRLISYAVQILIFGGLLFYVNWRLALAALIGAPLFVVVSRKFSRLIKVASRERRRRSGSVSAAAESSLRSARLITVYGAQDEEAAAYTRESAVSVRAEMAATRLRSLYSPLINMLELGGILVVLWVGANELIAGRLTLGGLLVFVAYLGQLYSPIRGMGRLSNSLYSAAAGAERLAELLDAEPTVRQPAKPVTPGRVVGELQLESVTYSYPGSPEPALHDLSLRIEPGSVVAVTGESGGGKSTLVALLLRLVDPTEGVVRLDGRDLRELDLDWLRGSSALALQDAPLLEGTVRSNLALANRSATDAQMWDALRAASTSSFVEKLDQGLDTPIGQRGRRLSGGEQVRIGVARAILRDAPIVVLDEPTAGLDDATAQHLMDHLVEHARGRTMVLVTHDPRVAGRASRVLRLSNGTITEGGSPRALGNGKAPQRSVAAGPPTLGAVAGVGVEGGS
jgi:ATP-binding cassette subfamily B protein